MRLIGILAAGAVFWAVLPGCATKSEPLPVARSVCIDVPQSTPQEVDYVRRKATGFLKDYGFPVVESGCDVAVQYAPFGSFQAEAVTNHGFWVSRSGYWSQEGIVSVKRGEKAVLEDHQVNLRGYSSKQYLLDDLAWQAVKPVTWLFSPATSPK
jgi:hypothetical protein